MFFLQKPKHVKKPSGRALIPLKKKLQEVLVIDHMSPEESVYELDNSDEESIPKLEKLVRDGGKEGGRECYSRKPPFLSKGSP